MDKSGVVWRGRAGGGALGETRPTTEIMWMPGGRHEITALKGGKAFKASVLVDRSGAAAVQRALENHRAASAHRPYFDLNHDDQAASGWPIEFVWRDGPAPGIYARLEWSEAGKRAVDGKEFRAFSPAFFADKGGKITGAPLNMGGLVNDPAFREILPLWAKDGRSLAGQNSRGKGSMRGQVEKIVMTKEARETLLAKKKTLEQELAGLRGQEQTAEVAEAIEAKEGELQSVGAELESDALKSRNAELEEAVLAQRQKDAEASVKAAVKRGAIPAKDEALQAKWVARCVGDPDTLELLDAIPGSPALARSRVTVPIGSVRIVRESSEDVLRAYNKEKNAKEKGAIYARDISKRIKDGEDMPIHASNTLGTLSGEIVTQRTLELLALEQPMLTAFSTDFSDAAVKSNQEINAEIVSVPGTSDYSEANGYSTENTVTTDVPVTIDEHKSCQVAFNANELAKTSRRLFDEQAPAMAYALGKAFVDKALALITTANYTETPVDCALIDFDTAVVTALGGALSDRGVPNINRTLMLKGNYYDALFKDPTVQLLAAHQRPDLITGSKMIDLHDFKVGRAPTLPATGNLTGFGMSKSALVIAARLPNDYTAALPGAASNGLVQTITEPRSGLSVMLVQFVDHLKGKAFSRIAVMYGAAKGQQAAGQILRSGA